MKPVDYEALIENIKSQINILEFDGARSGGHAKNAAPYLVALYELKDRYEAARVPQETKRPVGRPRKDAAA